MTLKQQLIVSGAIAFFIWCAWVFLLGPAHIYELIHSNWPISLTMAFGSVIAGATSEGGGAVAFPVFTKLLNISPVDAKVFSLAIQSVGMTAASLVIIFAKIRIEWRVIIWSSIGGVFGMFLGAYFLAPHVPPDVTKMTFTVMASSFAVVLLVMNRRERVCHERLHFGGARELMLLVCVGVAGGAVSSLVGTGLDIITFSMVVLLFRLNEKVATPTSVVLMAINSIVGMVVFGVLLGPLKTQVVSYWLSAVPVVVLGAPLGAVLCAYISRTLIAKLLIGLIAIELMTSILIINMRWEVVSYSMVTLILSLTMFTLMMRSRRYEPGNEAIECS